MCLRNHECATVTEIAKNAAGLATETLVDPPRTERLDTKAGRLQTAASLISNTPDPSVYRQATYACLPRLRQLMGSAPWFDVESRRALDEQAAARAMYKRQAVTLALALLADTNGGVDEGDYLRECVRASLIRWQLSLRGDGRPARRRLRRSPLHGAIAGLVAQLLTETHGHQTAVLLQDMASHLTWLTRQRRRMPWLEATTICAMADSAVIVRDLPLLKNARLRLKDLLEQQDREGWFPEEGGADVGRLSLTIDALARLYRQNDWEELREPLARACELMLRFVHPDGRIGGCYSSCGTAFLSPYGVELLAPIIAEAAPLARVARRRCVHLLAGGFAGWHDDLLAVMGSKLALAAVVAPPALPAGPDLPCQTNGQARFPNAGLSIFATDAYHAVVSGLNGGALHVTWRTGEPVLDDPGVTVVFPHRVRSSNRWHPRTCTHLTAVSVTSRGILQAPVGSAPRGWYGITAFRRRNESRPVERDDFTSPPGQGQVPAERRRLAHDWYRREITFGDNTIRIRDVVHCRLPCQAVICQSPPASRVDRLVDADAPGMSARPPLFVEGGRKVEILRTYQGGVLVEQRVTRG